LREKTLKLLKLYLLMGVTLHDWSREDRLKFRNAALGAWQEWKKEIS
jgi:hypothetical protein